MKKTFSKRLVTLTLAVLMAVTVLMPFTAEAAVNCRFKALSAGTYATESYNYNYDTGSHYTYYKITVPAAGELSFTLSSDAYIYLYNSSSDLVNQKNNNSHTYISYKSDCKSVAVEKGTYYLNVSSGKCKYKFIKGVNKGNYTVGKAVSLAAGKTVRIAFSPKMNYARWYKITTKKKQKISYWSNTGNNAYNIEIYNSKLQKLETVKAGSDVKYCTKAAQKKGTYYIRVKSQNRSYLDRDYAFGNVVTLKWK